MRRAELSNEDAKRILVGAVKNMASGQGATFSPWHLLHLTWSDNTLYRTDAYQPSQSRPMTPLLTLDELHGLSDAQIWLRVTGEP